MNSPIANLETPATNRRRPGAQLIVVVVLWICAGAAGMWFLWRYSATPGQQSGAPTRWPGDGLVALNPAGDTLVMFAHPHCPCTRASVDELQRVLTKNKRPVKVSIVFYKPANSKAGWEQGDLWKSAESLPNVERRIDEDGAEARRFGASTSGQLLLYGADGTLLYQGGITAARGHEGDNAGEDAVLDLLTTGESACRQTEVYGCPITPRDKSP